MLREEIKILQEKLDHHPDVTKFAMENLELRGSFALLRIIQFIVMSTGYLSKDKFRMILFEGFSGLLLMKFQWLLFG